MTQKETLGNGPIPTGLLLSGASTLLEEDGPDDPEAYAKNRFAESIDLFFGEDGVYENPFTMDDPRLVLANQYLSVVVDAAQACALHVMYYNARVSDIEASGGSYLMDLNPDSRAAFLVMVEVMGRLDYQERQGFGAKVSSIILSAPVSTGAILHKTQTLYLSAMVVLYFLATNNPHSRHLSMGHAASTILNAHRKDKK